MRFSSNSPIVDFLKNAQNLYLIQSKSPDYSNAKVTEIANGVEVRSDFRYRSSDIGQFGDLQSQDVNLYQFPAANGLFNFNMLALMMNGEQYEYVTLATKPAVGLYTINLNRNGFNDGFKVEIAAMGYSYSIDIPANSSSVQQFLTQVPIEAKAKLPWTTVETVVDLSQLEGNIINLELPQRPSQLVDANITIQLTCPDPTKSVRLNNLPGVPLLYRKSDAPEGTKWSKILSNGITWDYDSSTKTLNGGSFTANVEIGSSYTFKMTVDNKNYDATVTIDAQNFTYQEEVDEDYCD
jgi:hypothetical protein